MWTQAILGGEEGDSRALTQYKTTWTSLSTPLIFLHLSYAPMSLWIEITVIWGAGELHIQLKLLAKIRNWYIKKETRLLICNMLQITYKATEGSHYFWSTWTVRKDRLLMYCKVRNVYKFELCLTQALTCSICSQVRSLSSYLEMEGYDRPPFSSLQLQSFHSHVTERLEQEKVTVSQVMVRVAPFDFWKQHKTQMCGVLHYCCQGWNSLVFVSSVRVN